MEWKYYPTWLITSLILISQFAFTNESMEFRQDALIVKLTEEAASQINLKTGGDPAKTGLLSLDQLNQQHKVSAMTRIFPPAGKFEERHREFGLHLWYKISFMQENDAEALAAKYKTDSHIELAELDYMISLENGGKDTSSDNIQTEPIFSNDPSLGNQWHYHNEGQTGGSSDSDIDLPEAWSITTGSSGVIIGIIDTGVDVNHPDLSPAIWVNPGEIPGNRVDDDNNGFIDDVHGWNFGNNNNDLSDPEAHGTHVAGTVGAVTNNNMGGAGIAGGFGENGGVRLMVCKLNFSGGISDNAGAFVYAADNGAVIVNNSWTVGSLTSALRNAIDYFIANAGSSAGSSMDGGITVFSAGNDNTSDVHWPSDYSPTISVAATNHNDHKAGFSNYSTKVDISAPGVNVLSTFPNGGYNLLDGTSMAAPHVAGVLGLIASKYRGISNTAARTLVEFATEEIDHLNPGFEGMLGSGRLNAFWALQTPGSVSGVITDAASNVPIANAEIVDNVLGTKTLTNQNGEFLLKVFGDGDHELEIRRYGYESVIRNVTIDPNVEPGQIQTFTMDLSLTLNTLASFSGTIVDSVSLSPVRADVKITAISNKPGTPASVLDSATTDSVGGFTLSVLSNEDYRLDVFPQESPYPQSAQTVTNVPENGVEVTVQLVPADVMIVDDDGGKDYEKYYAASLPGLAKTYHIWEVAQNGPPAITDIQRFPARTLIWYTGDDSSTIDQAEHDVLLEHIDTGGRLFLTGQNIAEQHQGSALMARLGVTFDQNIGLPLVIGVQDDIADGQLLTTSGSGGANNQTSRDRLAIVDSTIARTIFTYGNTAAATAGAAIEVNSTRIVFWGFGWEAIGNSVARDQAMDIVLSYLDNAVTGIANEVANRPHQFTLHQNFPNPFNPTTTVSYHLAQSSDISLVVYNLNGQKVATLVRGLQNAGEHRVLFDAGNLSSGVYFYKLSAGSYSEIKKMILMK